jgi:deoxycytidylate deaminase
MGSSINNRLAIKLMDITKKLVNVPVGKNKHFTFFVIRNNILSIGWNDYTYEHPLCRRYNYGLKKMHSELSALIRFRHGIDMIQKCTAVNTRINSAGEIRISKPCPVCQNMLYEIGIKRVFYTDYNGDYVSLW